MKLINKFGAPILLGAFIGWILGDGLVLILTEMLASEFGDGDVSFINRLTTAFGGAFVYSRVARYKYSLKKTKINTTILDTIGIVYSLTIEYLVMYYSYIK